MDHTHNPQSVTTSTELGTPTYRGNKRQAGLVHSNTNARIIMFNNSGINVIDLNSIPLFFNFTELEQTNLQ